jgi:hypothetical protein
MQPQLNKSKCWQCSKKVGLLGLECACKYIFCKKCHFSENHQCTFDFLSSHQKQLKKDNPIIQASKLIRI